MKIAGIAVLAVCLLGGAGCKKGSAVENDTQAVSTDGRYLGIGTLPAGEMWGELNLNEQALDNAAARLDDDTQRIVVVDSKTGEVRQCGDMSGHCISMKPWDAAAVGGSSAPVRLKKHAADLRTEEEARRKRAEKQQRP